MPWKTTSVMDQKKQLIEEWHSGRYTKAALARRYGVSRTTVYEWIGRFQRHGPGGLQERSRAPRRQPRQVAPQVVEQIVELRSEVGYGAGKLKAIWEEEHPDQKWPARSTVAGILQRHGLTLPRQPRRQVPPRQQELTAAAEPNTLWCADFKGWFLAGDGRRCEPLTICDAASRYLLRCQLVPSPSEYWVQPWFETTFREYGLPQVIRTDNGPPFATTAIAGLSSLAVWWIRLGIWPERIDPGRPQQNGRLERLHRTLKQQAASPAAKTWRLQQQALDRFRQEYNERRPHEALGQRPPASCYVASARSYPERLAELEYPLGYRLRRVRPGGQFSWGGHDVFLTRALRGQVIGLEALDQRQSRIWFGPLELGILDGYQGTVAPAAAVAGRSGGAPRGAPSAAGNPMSSRS